MQEREVRTISYGYFVRIFAKIGAQAFGGWSTTALLLEEELVEKERVLIRHQLQGATAYAQLIPGATQVAIVSYVGYRLKGLLGSVIATICYLLPALSLIVLFAALYFHWHNLHIASHLNGLSAALGGVILASAYRIGKSHAHHPVLWLVIVAAFASRFFLGISTAIIILVCGFGGIAVGIFKYSQRTHK